jgi:putative DNA methylase
MTWDYGEGNPFSDSSGNFLRQFELVSYVLEQLHGDGPGSAIVQDAAVALGKGRVYSTDPPYYDNVPYADLSDFFYVWLRRSLSRIYPHLFSTVLVPKVQELVADPFRHGGRDASRQFFEEGMVRVFANIRESTSSGVPATVFYAFKQSEEDTGDAEAAMDDESHLGGNGRALRASTGWETMLQGLIDAGMQVTGTWPMRTERSARVRNIASNALASSIVLVCRPRPADASTASRREFITALKRELPEALRDLQRGNIAPVDLAQASIGPGMAVFSRYVRVLEADGKPMTVRTALQLINQALDEVLSEQEGEFDADTRWAIAWFEQSGTEEGPFGQADVLARAKNTSVGGLVQAEIVAAKGGKVRLLRRDELPADWDPASDPRRTVWETTQHLIRALDQMGEDGAAALLRKVGARGEIARDLAYRLYTTCERKKWAQEALAYNSLVIAWPQGARLALSAAKAEQQGALFE